MGNKHTLPRWRCSPFPGDAVGFSRAFAGNRRECPSSNYRMHGQDKEYVQWHEEAY
jgi:hypothetical protein